MNPLPIACTECGSDNTVPVWESKLRHIIGFAPKFVGCEDCHTMKKYEEPYYDVNRE